MYKWFQYNSLTEIFSKKKKKKKCVGSNNNKTIYKD